MIERIKLPTQEWLGYDPERGDLHGYTFEQMREFSELIVRECVDTLNQQYVTISDDADFSDNKTWIGATMNSTVDRCKHSILNKFGVTE